MALLNIQMEIKEWIEKAPPQLNMFAEQICYPVSSSWVLKNVSI